MHRYNRISSKRKNASKLAACSLWLAAIFLISCSPVTKHALGKRFKSLETSLQDHAGFMLYDPEKKKEIYSFQADRYFAPASNIKILTLYAGLVLLGDSIPALHYIVKGDSLIFKGTGDPSFLHDKVWQSNKVFQFLEESDHQLFLCEDNFFTEPLGRGWAWDDRTAGTLGFVERSALPMYRNYLSLQRNAGKLKVHPALFSYQISIRDSAQKSDAVRDIGSNKISFYPGRNGQALEKWEIPFKTSHELTASFLTDTLKKKVTVYKSPIGNSVKTLCSTPADSLYREMMQESDNFIAEQLLLVCSQALSDSLKPEIAIQYMKKNHLKDLPDVPVWIDGSGVSRYNLLTPRSIVKLWEKIDQKVPRERLFKLLAIGGKTGTLKNYYKNDPPYIYGKTGTLTNNYALSGYLVTKKGHTLIFSFMNSNYPMPVSAMRGETEKILKDIYLYY